MYIDAILRNDGFNKAPQRPHFSLFTFHLSLCNRLEEATRLLITHYSLLIKNPAFRAGLSAYKTKVLLLGLVV